MHDYPHAAENEALKKTLDKEIETMKRTGKIVDRVYGTEEHEIMVVSAKAKPTTNLADVHKVERELPKEVHEKALKGNAKSFGMAQVVMTCKSIDAEQSTGCLIIKRSQNSHQRRAQKAATESVQETLTGHQVLLRLSTSNTPHMGSLFIFMDKQFVTY